MGQESPYVRDPYTSPRAVRRRYRSSDPLALSLIHGAARGHPYTPARGRGGATAQGASPLA